MSGKYNVEVDGVHKSFKQIANLPHSFLEADDDLTGMQYKVPLWMFGFCIEGRV